VSLSGAVYGSAWRGSEQGGDPQAQEYLPDKDRRNTGSFDYRIRGPPPKNGEEEQSTRELKR